MAIRYKESLPFEVNFVVPGTDGRPNKPIPIQVFWETESEMDRSLFQFIHEGVPLEVIFRSELEVASRDSVLYIETSRFNEMGDHQPFSIPLERESFTLFTRDQRDSEQEEFPWRLGNYFIKVRIGDRNYYSGIQVVPNNLTLEQVNQIHDRLENEVEGLCYEFILSQKAFTESDIEESPERWYYDYVMWILDRKELIQGFLQSIERNPHDDVKTEYNVSTRAGRQDARTERWLQTSHGMSYNQGITPPLFALNRMKQINLDTAPNRWIKKIVSMWKSELMEVSKLLVTDIETMQQEETQLKISMDQAKELIERLQKARDVYDKYKKVSRSQFLQTQAKRNAIQKRRLILVDWLRVVESLLGRFSYFLAHSFFLNVSEIGTKPRLKQRDYFRLNELFEECRQIKKEDGDARLYKKILRPTWRVYEYFVYFEIIDALHDLGFEIIQGIPARVESLNEQGIEDGTCVVLENEKGQLHIWFNKMLPFTWPDAQQQGESFYLFGEHRWPDIRVDYYKRMASGNFQYSKHSLVADAKLTKFRYLQNPDGLPTKAQAQLTTYLNVSYRTTVRHVVDRVLCLYSGLGESRAALRQVHPITFIQLFPNPDDLEDVWGYNELRETLESWLRDDVGVLLEHEQVIQDG